MEAVQSHRKKLLDSILRQLADREREIIASRFGLRYGEEPQTLQQVGDTLGISKERIRQIEGRALVKLRKVLVREGLTGVLEPHLEEERLLAAVSASADKDEARRSAPSRSTGTKLAEVTGQIRNAKTGEMPGLADRPLPGQEIQRRIAVHRHPAQPASELVDHEPGGNRGGIDRAAGGAAADLGFGLPEERRRVMLPADVVGHGEHADHLRQHPAVSPETTPCALPTPDRGTGVDRVHRAKHGLADLHLGRYRSSTVSTWMVGSIWRMAVSVARTLVMPTSASA